jgi:hypothetical protein
MVDYDPKTCFMKKSIALLMAFLLVFSINGFSQTKSHKKVQSAKTEQHSKNSGKSRHKPPKAKHGKKIHKSKSKRPSQTKTGKAIRL